MAKNRPSFGDSVSKGLQDTYVAPPAKSSPPPQNDSSNSGSSGGVNPYYDYHPKTGARGGTLGAPRKSQKKVQFSVGCTEEEKMFYQRAALKAGRKFPDFVNTAIKEYIQRHELDV